MSQGMQCRRASGPVGAQLGYPSCRYLSSPRPGAERAGRGGRFQRLAVFPSYLQRLSGGVAHLTLPLLRNRPLPLPPLARAERDLLAGAGSMRSPCPARRHALRPILGSARRRASAFRAPCRRQRLTQTGGAQSHGRSQEKNLAVAAGHAAQPPGLADRGACRVPQLRRAQATAPRLQPLRPLRRPRDRGRRRWAERRGPRLTTDQRDPAGLP